MNFLKHKKIATTIASVFVTLIIVVTVCGLGSFCLATIAGDHATARAQADKINLASVETLAAVSDVAARLGGASGPQDLAVLRQDLTQALAWAEQARRGGGLEPEVARHIDALLAAKAAWHAPEGEAAAPPADEDRRRLNEIRRAAQELRAAAQVSADAAGTRSAESFVLLRQAALATTLLLGLVSILAGVSLLRGLAKPLAAVAACMRRVAEGDLDVIVLGQERRDEIGRMAVSVEMFKQEAIEQVRLEREAAEAQARAEAERSQEDADRAAAAARQAEVVASIAKGLARLSAGDLVFRLEETFPSIYEKLRFDFNGAMEHLQDTMKVVASNTAAIRSGSDDISVAADDLSSRTERQAASLEQTAAALNQITATVRRTAEGANLARDVVGAAKKDTESSGQIVRQAVEAMGSIEKSSGQIGQIIGVIDEIAFQTNLLALNAGVEAARAGDAGRGFAVVAAEVRALAQRSASAAKEIKTLISTSKTQVVQGVSLVGQTGKALTRIMQQVNEINGIVQTIAASAEEQATGLDQINAAVTQMDQVTQQNAAMVEESTAASHALKQETEQLARLIGRFDVGRTVAPVSAARPVQTSKTASRAQTPVAALKTFGQAAAAPKVEEAAADNDWIEF